MADAQRNKRPSRGVGPCPAVEHNPARPRLPQSNKGFDQLVLTVTLDASDTNDFARMDLELDAIDRGVPQVGVDTESLQLHAGLAGTGGALGDLQNDGPADHQPS